jgi:hypothetical protein
MGRQYENIYGRRGGRGTRPYLLVAKLVFVAAFIGGLVSVLILVLLPPLPVTGEGRRLYADALHRAYAWVVIPSLVGAMTCGMALLASFWRVAIRLRWLQVKVLLIVLCVPLLHTFMRHRSQTLQEMLAADQPDGQVLASFRDQILAGTIAALAFGILTAVLGRVKPRLGQQIGPRARTRLL